MHTERTYDYRVTPSVILYRETAERTTFAEVKNILHNLIVVLIAA